MAQTKATGLLMPKVPDGQTRRPPVTAGSPGYIPAYASTGGRVATDQPLGAIDLQSDLEEDDTYGSVEVGVVAIPHFPREARMFFAGHGAKAIPIKELHTYTHQAPKYAQVLLPGLLGDDATGLPEEEVFTDEVASVSASEGAKFGGNIRGSAIPSEMTRGTQAHQANQIMSDAETSPTGATGVWSITGRV